jgi:chemotaxis signal transduction protein
MVAGIEWVEKSRVQTPESLQSTVKAEYLKGHIKPAKDEPWMTFLDVDKIVRGPELFVGRK